MSDPVTRLNAALEGRYAIVREIGEGGMATVYLADDVKHDRRVALKVLKPELVAVQFTEDPRFTPGRQDILFSMDRYQVADGSPLYDVSADDRRFVMLRIEDSDTDLILVRNFFEELRERAGN